MSLLSKAYSSACYIKEEHRITLEVLEKKTFITKSRFCSLLGLEHTANMVGPDSITIVAIMEMFYQMGYKETLTSISKFRKPNMLPQWNGLFTLIFKSFSERVTSSDYANKLYMNIMYGIYIGENIDDGVVLWAQLVQSTHSTNRHSEISCARFWTIVVQRAIERHKIPVM